MADILLSEAEKTFILHGVRDNVRNDGRSCSEFRPIELELGLVENANGSARVRLANTDVLVAVKCEIDNPPSNFPDEGKLDFFVDCSANATPQFEGKGGEQLAVELAALMSRAYQTRESFNLSTLSIIKGMKCWKLCIDVLILECGGSLIDAISMGTKAALADTKIPKVSVIGSDEGTLELELADEADGREEPLDWHHAPCLVTLNKLEDSLLVDASAEEEACCAAALIVGVSPNKKITTTSIPGHGSFLADSKIFARALNLAVDVGVKLNTALEAAIKKHQTLKPPPRGFLD
ncbi:Hypothetical predicted protein [Cloeon dipterum]|uniref:Ribosomal RNA-processing protein 42 n=1 Tax=Cloeon dipterum TaxID=197152 RepID=A0A8S1CFC4_9INSE|nr:Hypothetical predicted protein [Cloeon dipterum]